jgi:hypothetical protein
MNFKWRWSMYYFLNQERTLCHIIKDIRTGEAPDTCGAQAPKSDIINYRYGKPHGLLEKKPVTIPLCMGCEKGMAWAR